MKKLRFALAGVGSAAILAGVAATPASANEWLPECGAYRCINAWALNNTEFPLTRADHEPWNDGSQDNKYDPPKTIPLGNEGRWGQLGTIREGSGSPTHTFFNTWYRFKDGEKVWQVKFGADTSTFTGDQAECLIGEAGEKGNEWETIPKKNGEGTPYKCTAEISTPGYHAKATFNLMHRF